jgi:hypothetical protein
MENGELYSISVAKFDNLEEVIWVNTFTNKRVGECKNGNLGVFWSSLKTEETINAASVLDKIFTSRIAHDFFAGRLQPGADFKPCCWTDA